jgi:tetratricopeptide (TPR) repeat protein
MNIEHRNVNARALASSPFVVGCWMFGVLLLFLTSAHAQNIIMKDGKVIATKGVRRQGDTIMATVELPGGEAGKPAKTGELGYPVAQIAKLDFPEPAQLKTAPDLIAQGKGSDALAQLEPIVKYYEGFRDAPGSWWADAALLKVQALASLGRENEAEPLAEQIGRMATDPETKRAADVQVAAGFARKGNHVRALELAEAAIKESKDPATLAPAYVIKGQCLLAKKEWDDAVLAFLEVPVFYPNEKVLLPQAMLGRGRAHFGMDDLPAAKATLNELIKTYPNAAEAKQAEAELTKIARREKALAAPK